MTSFELITCLPSALSCTIMQDWLSLKSVVALDSAFCCHLHRITYLDLVRSDEYHIHEQITIERQSRILSVLHLYGEKLRSVVIRSRFLPAQEELLVRNCRNLTHVRFQGTDTCMCELVQIMNDGIILVDLAKTNLKCFSSLQIPLSRNLMCLGLGNTGLKSQTLGKFINSCPNVVWLDVIYNGKLIDADILSIVTRWKSLRGLNIDGCASLTDTSLHHIQKHCATTLHILQMKCYLDLFSADATNAVLEQCTQLRTLHIGRFGLNIFGTIQLSIIALRNITTLVLGGFVRVENIGAANSFPMKLQTLVISLFHAWDGLLNLVRCCPNLKEVYLDTYGEKGTFESVASALKTIKPGVEITHMSLWESCKKHLVMNM